jgi:hypothetical membrane protein
MQMRRFSVTQAAWLAGPASGLLFAGSVISFALLRTDEYSHATKAISELGSVGAPNAWLFNLLGLIIPGALIMFFGLALREIAARKVGPLLVTGSGAFLALAGLSPAQLDDYSAMTTFWHVIGAVGCGTLWVIGLFWLAPLMSRELGLKIWGRLTPWFSIFLFANIGWQVAFRATGLVMPGWGQRIGFLGYFVWLGITGCLLWQADRTGDAGAA